MRHTIKLLFLSYIIIAVQACSSGSSNQSTESQETTELTNTQIAEQNWKEFCNYPSGNEDIEINQSNCIISYCDGGYDGWNQYLLLVKQSDGSYYKEVIEKRSSLPDETQEYYAFPVFTPSKFEAIDINKDGQEELLITISVTGKATGAGAEVEEYWDEEFYEVYAYENDKLVYSENLKNDYITSKETANFANEVDMNVYKIMERLAGDYVEAGQAEGELLYGKCGGINMSIGKFGNDRVYKLQFELLMDVYQIEVEDIVMEEANGNYVLFCKGNEYVEKFDIEVWEENGRTLHFTDGRYYIAAKDKDKFAQNTEECEEYESEGEGEGEGEDEVYAENILKFESVGHISGDLYISMMGMEEDEYVGFAGIDIEGFDMSDNPYFEEDPDHEGVMIQYRLKEGIADKWYRISYKGEPVDIGNEEPETMYFIKKIEEFER